jgi:hypothetical protein
MRKKKRIWGDLWRIVPILIATIAMLVSLSNRRDLRWMEKVQDNFIEQVLFPDIR